MHDRKSRHGRCSAITDIMYYQRMIIVIMGCTLHSCAIVSLSRRKRCYRIFRTAVQRGRHTSSLKIMFAPID